MATAGEKIVLGSGDLFVKEFIGEIPSDEEIETDDNQLGFISGGASLEYKPKFYEAQDDLGQVKKTILTEEEATFKSGVITWNGKTLTVLCSTARIEEKAGKRIVKVGGVNNQNGKKYLIRFRHKDEIDGDIRVTIVGSNQAGFNLAFKKDKETVVDAEFKAQPMDKEGTLILYVEDIPQSTTTTTIGKRYFGIKIEKELTDVETMQTITVDLDVEPPKLKVLKKITALAKVRSEDAFDDLTEALRLILSKNKTGTKVPEELIGELDFDEMNEILTRYFEWLAQSKNSPN
jgi:hypothetical protein